MASLVNYDESEKRFVRLNVSAKGMRIIDKKGIENKNPLKVAS